MKAPVNITDAIGSGYTKRVLQISTLSFAPRKLKG